jgi:hypothetical protein
MLAHQPRVPTPAILGNRGFVNINANRVQLEFVEAMQDHRVDLAAARQLTRRQFPTRFVGTEQKFVFPIIDCTVIKEEQSRSKTNLVFNFGSDCT